MKVVALTVALLAISAAASAESLRDTAERMGNKASAALAHKDFKAFAAAVRASVTPGFKYVEMGKGMSFDQMIAGVKQGVGTIPKVTGASSKVLTCIEHGRTGITTTSHKITGEVTGKDGKHHKLVAVGTSRDAWVKTGDAWKMSVMTWGTQKMTLDGKPFNPMAGAPKPAGSK